MLYSTRVLPSRPKINNYITITSPMPGLLPNCSTTTGYFANAWVTSELLLNKQAHTFRFHVVGLLVDVFIYIKSPIELSSSICAKNSRLSTTNWWQNRDFNHEDDFLQTIGYCSGYPITIELLCAKIPKKINAAFSENVRKTLKNSQNRLKSRDWHLQKNRKSKVHN